MSICSLFSIVSATTTYTMFSLLYVPLFVDRKAIYLFISMDRMMKALGWDSFLLTLDAEAIGISNASILILRFWAYSCTLPFSTHPTIWHVVNEHSFLSTSSSNVALINSSLCTDASFNFLITSIQGAFDVISFWTCWSWALASFATPAHVFVSFYTLLVTIEIQLFYCHLAFL